MGSKDINQNFNSSFHQGPHLSWKAIYMPNFYLNLALVNIIVYIKFGQNPSIHSWDIQQELNFKVNQGP